MKVCVFVSPLRAACVIEDDEECAILAAVLFPNEPDVPERMKTELERNAYLASVRVHLSGFEGSSYRIQDEAVPDKGARNQTNSSIKTSLQRADRDAELTARNSAHMFPGKDMSPL